MRWLGLVGGAKSTLVASFLHFDLCIMVGISGEAAGFQGTE
jgi:hypothetical protein